VAILDRALVRFLPAVPRPIVRRISQRYIAGTEVGDACRVVGEINSERKMATIDVLGEEVTNPSEARSIAAAYREVFDAIEDEHLDSNVSVKLTGLGLKLNYDLCRENLVSIVDRAAESSNFVRIDMEDSSCTDDTLSLYRELRAEGRDNVGIVLQARLRRTIRDIAALAAFQPNVRLCKGIYLEPEKIAFQGFDEIRRAFARAHEALLAGGSYVAVATHDDWLVQRGRWLVAEYGLEREQYEFQMLLGVRKARGDALVRDGHRLRIYVPFGRQWYEYSVRRLKENPKIAGYIAADTFNRLLSRNGNQLG
jgi:proline dehydrogenase